MSEEICTICEGSGQDVNLNPCSYCASSGWEIVQGPIDGSKAHLLANLAIEKAFCKCELVHGDNPACGVHHIDPNHLIDYGTWESL